MFTKREKMILCLIVFTSIGILTFVFNFILTTFGTLVGFKAVILACYFALMVYITKMVIEVACRKKRRKMENGGY